MCECVFIERQTERETERGAHGIVVIIIRSGSAI